MDTIKPHQNSPFVTTNTTKVEKILKYENHKIKNLTATPSKITACAAEVFEIPVAPPAPLPAAKVKVHPKATHLTDEVTKTFATRNVVDLKKIEALDTAATKKRLEVAHKEFHEERAIGSTAQTGKEKEAIKEKAVDHSKTNQQPRQTVKGKKKEKSADKTAKQDKAPSDKKAKEMRSSLANFVQQASEEKKERDLLDQKLEAKKEGIEEDQKKIDKRFYRE